MIRQRQWSLKHRALFFEYSVEWSLKSGVIHQCWVYGLSIKGHCPSSKTHWKEGEFDLFASLGGVSSFFFIIWHTLRASTASIDRIKWRVRKKPTRGHDPSLQQIRTSSYINSDWREDCHSHLGGHLGTSFSVHLRLVFWPTNGESIAMIVCFFSIKPFWNLWNKYFCMTPSWINQHTRLPVQKQWAEEWMKMMTDDDDCDAMMTMMVVMTMMMTIMIEDGW